MEDLREDLRPRLVVDPRPRSISPDVGRAMARVRPGENFLALPEQPQLRRSKSDRAPKSRKEPDSTRQRPFPVSRSSSVLGEQGYQFKPLDDGCIRLIEILPERKTAIRCRIIHVSLDKLPPYVAISYAWGDAGDTRKIEVEDCLVPVSVSLHGALQALRQRGESVLVWVDALSIDQQNSEERTQQIQLMTSIYSKADHVAIWLGPEEDNSAIAVGFLGDIAKLANYPDRVSRILSSRDTINELLAVVSLYERPYWRRLWVVQEVQNAKKLYIYCGNTFASFNVYQIASDLFSRHRNDIVDLTNIAHKRQAAVAPDQLSHDQVLIYQGPASLPDIDTFKKDREAALLEVLCATRRKLSSDPRDKLYGILGVLRPEIRNEFRADYNLSVKEVYSDIVDYLITSTERLDVICEAIHFPPHTGSAILPSFVPDWSHIPQTTSLGRKYSFKASGSTRARRRFLDERLNKLEISAVYLSTVKVKGIAVGTLCNIGDYIMAFLHWRALLLDNIASEGDDVRRIVQEDFAATLSVGQIPPTHDRPGEWLDTCYNIFGSTIRGRLPYLPLDRSLERYLDIPINVKPEARRQFLQKHFGDKMMGRSFCITEDNYLGLGSGAMLPGDEVVVPLGCSTPILLRQEGTRGEYRYVGDVYIHEYMDGKAIDQWSAGTKELRKYVLH